MAGENMDAGNGPLSGRIAVVTGGAGGIGSAIVRAFVAAGARVVIGDLLQDSGASLEAELGDAAMYFPLDVTSLVRGPR
jgi:3alpha(or 20beta)-hydroxysteroid dehydrogenase